MVGDRVSAFPLINDSAVLCPACGGRIEQTGLPRCPACGVGLQADGTGADVTPYSATFAEGEPRWWEMARWVCFAGWGRLKHLALIRASTASRHFANISLLLLATAFTLLEITRHGWRTVTTSGPMETLKAIKPLGRGWLHIAATPRLPDGGDVPGVRTDLWWNMTHTVTAAAVAMLVGWCVMKLVLRGIKLGGVWAHKPPYRSDGRMSAAIDYGTAWCIPILLGGIVSALRLVSIVGSIAEWSWYPPARGIDLTAGVLAGLGIVMWWFWLIRLAAAAPAETRGRVVAFFAVGAPMWIGVVAAAWWLLIEPMYLPLFRMLGVGF